MRNAPVILTAVGFVAFLAMILAAMKSYPDYDFWRNVWCALFAASLPDGAPNPARAAAGAALAGLVLGALPLWILLPRRIGASVHMRRLMTFCGLAAALGAILVPLDVDDPAFHAGAILVAGTPFFVALLSSLWLVPHPLGIATAMASAINFGQWVRLAFLGATPSLVLPIAQKCATILLFFWLVLRAVRTYAKRRP